MSANAGPVLGIDLGTTNSVVSIADGKTARVIADPDGNRLIPSCVSFHPDGTVLVGHVARERRLVDAANTVYSIKRLIGRPFTSPEVARAIERFPFELIPGKTGGVQVRVRKGTYALPEISAMVLRHLRKVAEADLEVECKRAVITVPANFNELQRSATQAAGKVAGLEVLRVLNEPTAATLAYGYGRDKPETVAVYDLGGGTFDITILELDGDVFEVVSTAGDTFLGGDDINVLVADNMAAACLAQHRFDTRNEPQTYERMRAAGEWAKCQLSSVTEAELTLEQLFDDGNGRIIDFTFRMTQAELEDAMRPLIARSLDVVQEALRTSGRRPKEIDSVVMVGGSTRIPLVRRMVEEFFGKKPRTDIDPDLVVGQGAAIHGWTLAGRPEGSSIRPPSVASPLRKVTVADLPPSKKKLEPNAPALKAKEALPRQPAFAPEEAPLKIVPVPINAPVIIGATPLALDADPFARTSLEPQQRAPVAVIAPPKAIGRQDSGLLDLDDPMAKSPRRKSSPNLPAARKKARSPLPEVDAPFDVPSLRDSKNVRRDHTLPFGHRAKNAAPAPPAITAPALPQRESEPEVLAELDLQSIPPKPPKPPPPPARAMRAANAPIESMPPEALSLESLPPESPAPESLPPELLLSESPPPVTDAALPATDPFAGAPLELAPFDSSDPFASLSLDRTSAAAPISFSDSVPAPVIAPLAPRIADLPMRAAATPLLMDVTPLSLGLETAGGYCQPIVPRNAPLPTEKSRMFSTARDDQEAVEVRICQGESQRFADNQLLGTLAMEGIRKARRGQVRIEITFVLDASGILDVRALDLDTKRSQSTRIRLQGGLDQGEIDAMRTRQERELVGP